MDEVMGIFRRIQSRWAKLVAEEQRKEDTIYQTGEGAYLRRFSPGWVYTRIIHKATSIMGRLKEHELEHQTLTELLDQQLFHASRRGAWYQRKALLEEHYMAAIEMAKSTDSQGEMTKKRQWTNRALRTCELGLQDPQCHVIYHYDLQKRIKKLEKALKIAKRFQHDFSHVLLQKPMERVVEGIQVLTQSEDDADRRGAKTVWIDTLNDDAESSVEAMCLSWYRSQGWKGMLSCHFALGA
jgi:Fanconi-associated nuclease 1